MDYQTRAMTHISGDEAGPWMEASVGPALGAAARVVAFSPRQPVDGGAVTTISIVHRDPLVSTKEA